MLKGCLITRNGGSGVCGPTDQGRLTIANCTIAYNYSYGLGGVEWEGTISNTIVWGNWNDRVFSENVEICYSVVHGWYGPPSAGNFYLDPKLTEDGHLRADSPCIDAGDPDCVPAPDEADIDGEPRVAAGRVDIGPMSSSTRMATLWRIGGSSATSTVLLLETHTLIRTVTGGTIATNMGAARTPFVRR